MYIYTYQIGRMLKMNKNAEWKLKMDNNKLIHTYIYQPSRSKFNKTNK